MRRTIVNQITALLVGTLLYTLGTTSWASIILFENTAPGGGTDGACDFQCDTFAGGDFIGAENFTLAQASTIEQITFGAAVPGGNLSTVSVDWTIWSDGGATPGSVLLHSGTVSPTISGSSPVQFVLDILDISLAANSYWIGFDVNTDILSDPIYWSRAEDGDSRSARSNDGGVSWISPYAARGSNGFVFSVVGTVGDGEVPAPATLALFGLGLASLGWSKRRKA